MGDVTVRQEVVSASNLRDTAVFSGCIDRDVFSERVVISYFD
jgi:hypothetical protein